jgi:hypothetical protein
MSMEEALKKFKENYVKLDQKEMVDEVINRNRQKQAMKNQLKKKS